MRFFLFIVSLAVVLGSITVFYLGYLEETRPPEPAPQQQADKLRPLIEKGDVRALVALGDMYRSGTGGVSQSYVAAKRLYEAAARKGHPPAQFAMGRAYENGEGVREEPAIAVRWYEPAARLGRNADALYALGQLNEKGRGVPYDPARALELYLEAATYGHPVAQYLAGIAFEQGHDGDPDIIEAYRWYLLAVEKAPAVKAANPQYKPASAIKRLQATMNRSQLAEAQKRATRTKAAYQR